MLHQDCLSRTGLQFTPKTFVPALLHQLSRTGSPIHSENFRSSVSPPTVKYRLLHQLSNFSFAQGAGPPTVKEVSLRRCSPNCQGQVTPKGLSFQRQRCSTNCQGQVLQFTPKGSTNCQVQVLSNSHRRLSQSSAAPPTVQGQVLQFEDFRSSAAPPTVKDMFSNSHRRLSLRRCSTNCQGTGSPIHTEDFRSAAAAPPAVKDRYSNSHRRLSLQRCSTFAPPIVKDRLFNSHRRLSPALLHQLSRTSFPIHTEDFRSSAAPPTFKTGSPIHTAVPALHHQLSNRFSTHSRLLQFEERFTEDFRSSAAPPTVKDRINSHRRLSFQRFHQLSRRISNSHRRLSFQRCSTNCQGQ